MFTGLKYPKQKINTLSSGTNFKKKQTKKHITTKLGLYKESKVDFTFLKIS